MINSSSGFDLISKINQHCRGIIIPHKNSSDTQTLEQEKNLVNYLLDLWGSETDFLSGEGNHLLIGENFGRSFFILRLELMDKNLGSFLKQNYGTLLQKEAETLGPDDFIGYLGSQADLKEVEGLKKNINNLFIRPLL